MGLDYRSIYTDVLTANGCTLGFSKALVSGFMTWLEPSGYRMPSMHEFRVLCMDAIGSCQGLPVERVVAELVTLWERKVGPAHRVIKPMLDQGYPILTVVVGERVTEVYCRARVGNQLIASPKYTLPKGTPEDVTTKAADMAVDDVCRELASRGIDFNMKGAIDG